MIKACLALAFFSLFCALPLRAFDWEAVTVNGREYVTLHSFCTFYNFGYQAPSGNDRFVSRNANHSISLKIGNSDIYLDGVHYVMSFPVEGGDHDWLVSRMDVIKLFDPVLRPTEISGSHSIRGVVIDAGHGGTDNGATSRYGAEKDYTRDTAFRLEAILRNAGLKTVLTRRTDVFVDLYERAHIASLYSDYCFVSIHYNSATPEARGLETYCLSPRGAASTSSAYLTRGDIQKLPGNDYDALNILLASLVHSEIIRLNPGDPSADRGVKRARFVVIKQNVLPAILVEGGFVSNRMEAARVNTPGYRQSLAQAIARGVIRFVNVMSDRNISLPGLNPDADAPAPKPIAPAPAAPSGLARDPAYGTTFAPSAHAPRPATSSMATSSREDRSNKDRKAGSSVPSHVPPALAPVPTTTSAATTPQKPSASLNLGEPAVPTPTPGADKAAPEPDEPGAVTIYPTAPLQSPGDAAKVQVQTQPPSPPPSSGSDTNAPPSSAPPITTRP